MFVSASYSPALPIPFSQFRSDMMTKWRYQYGDPAIREKLWESQANYYNALASMGIPSEADYRRAMAHYYLTQAHHQGIEPSLVSSFMDILKEVGLLPTDEENKGILNNTIALPEK